MNVLIVEDEVLAYERLEKLLNDCDPEINILTNLDTVQEASLYMDQHRDKIDLVFLDIQLADGKSFEIFSKIDYDKPIIFTTAYDEYALKAFKVNSIDYLLKPIKIAELEAGLMKFKRLEKDVNESQKINKEFIENILSKNTSNYKQRFLVKIGNRIQFVNTSEAGYFYAQDKTCYLISKQGKKYMIDHTLEELDTQLLDPTHFFRISRQHIINIDLIREVKSFDVNRFQVILKTNDQNHLTVSRNRSGDFKKWLNK